MEWDNMSMSLERGMIVKSNKVNSRSTVSNALGDISHSGLLSKTGSRQVVCSKSKFRTGPRLLDVQKVSHRLTVSFLSHYYYSIITYNICNYTD